MLEIQNVKMTNQMSYGFYVQKTGLEPGSVWLQSSSALPLSFIISVLSHLLKVHEGFGKKPMAL